MPDDRPVSPEERLREFIAARREGLDALDRRSEFFEREYRQGFRACLEDLEANVLPALSTPAGPRCPEGCYEGVIHHVRSSDNKPCPRCAPSPREEAVEAVTVDCERGPNGGIVVPVAPCGRISDEWCGPYESCCRRSGPVEKIEMWPALSAARPSSPTPEEVWKDEAAFPHLSGYAARSADPGDDATTKEGR